MTPRAIHIMYICMIFISIVFFYTWISEHDARIIAEQKISISQSNINTIQQQIQDQDHKFTETLNELKKKSSNVTTPEKAIISIPDVSSIPFRPIPNTSDIELNAVQYYKEQEQCQEKSIQLSQCSSDLSLEKQTITEKDKQIKALNKKPRLFHRVLSSLRNGAILVSVGMAIGKTGIL